MRPEILSLSKKTLDEYLAAKEMQPFRLVLERIIRFKPYTLREREEEILAMQGEMAGAAGKAFRQLLDADMKFGLVKDEKGQQVELSNATYSKLLVSPERSVRKTAFHQYYEQFKSHENTLAATLTGPLGVSVLAILRRAGSSAASKARLNRRCFPTTYRSSCTTT